MVISTARTVIYVTQLPSILSVWERCQMLMHMHMHMHVHMHMGWQSSESKVFLQARD